MNGSSVTPPRAFGSRLLALAAVPGLVQAGFSAYWMLGGTWLIETLGSSVVGLFAGRLWLLAPVVAVKLVVAGAPYWLDRRGWPWRPATRGAAWLAVAALIGWGGLSCVVAQLTLAGVLGDGPIDRASMIGHAWLWDPLFVIWGGLLALGLRAGSRRAGSRPGGGLAAGGGWQRVAGRGRGEGGGGQRRAW